MASKNFNFYTIFHLLPFILVSVLVFDLPHVRGRSLATSNKEDSGTAKGTVKTIEGYEDVVDCVDIYKQPAFNHPLLKDHKIHMDPSSFPSKSNNGSNNNVAPELMQPWHKYGSCSEGSVPIRRRRLQDQNDSNTVTIGPHHEKAYVHTNPTTNTSFYGGRGQLSLWEPAVSRSRDFSAATLTVLLQDGDKGAFLMAGWMVHERLYGDFQSRFFIYWTTDDSVPTNGCYDLNCEGFVQVNQKYAIGSTFESVSTVGSDHQLVLEFTIAMDRKTRNWWLYVEREAIGYWPAALFTRIPEGAWQISWGGQVYDSVGSGQHTETDMGNGLFPDIGTYEASSICSLQYVDSTLSLQTPLPSMLELDVTNPLCYDARLVPGIDPSRGLCLLYGGSGRNAKCP